ncbi:HPP family protein [Devosia sp. XJ19-1]|uniref:HPP family protein n=1 Tax=Devosia ureilytica TaxID=2952754 RepID=A0A9Q4FSJ4_9HYPH|nr:HPP family protein [Devosia ureilytica]MCP8882702.1 HPP family protein [Devosia ureilytica]MCP8886930.1 HPP family protein [Devosia ureilytica]
MHKLIARFIARHEPRHDWRVHAKSAAATGAAVTLIGYLSAVTGLPLLLAPLGPTALVIFGQPDSPNAQPINIFAGYFIGSVLAVLAMSVVPEPWWLATLCVGLVMLIMLVLRVTHPPAAAVPLLAYGAKVDGLTLFLVLLLACTLLVVLGMVIHRLPPRRRYPLPLAEEIEKE